MILLVNACNQGTESSKLFTLNGQELQDDTGTAVYVFLNTECPICQKYQGDLNFERDSVSYFLVFSSAQDTAAIRAFIQYDSIPERRVIIDKSCKLASDLKAIVSPQAVVIANNKIVYSGLIDDRYKELGAGKANPSVNYIRNALNSLRKHERIQIPSTKAVGCFIEPQ